MSTSPCCAGYKFPAAAAAGAEPSCLEAAASPETADGPADYFAMRPPLLTKLTFVSPKKTHFRKPTLGLTSLAGSEATLGDHASFSSDYFSVSTDTLVEEPDSLLPQQPRRNVLLLKLSVKKPLSPFAAAPFGAAPDFKLDRKKFPSAVEGHNPFAQRNLSVGADLADELRTKLAPRLRKQLTLPLFSPTHEISFVNSIKTEQAKRSLLVPPQENMRAAITALLPTISYLPPAEIAARVEVAALLKHIVIDIRTFADFAKHHVNGSINVCLPLTLLKRPNFSFTRCINSLPAYEKAMIQAYLLHAEGRLPPIIVYDNVNTSASLYHMCKKLVDHSCWSADAAPDIYLMDSTFDHFQALHPSVVYTGNSDMKDVDALKTVVAETDPRGRPKLTINVSPRAPLRSQSTQGFNSATRLEFDMSTPTVSNFSLPANLPQSKFKIRHNEEVFDISENPIHEELISTAAITESELDALPAWLKGALAEPSTIRGAFARLEECEKTRLNAALSLTAQQELITPGGRKEPCLAISCGLDYGHKNRYKDIFLYEHSRVKLRATSGYQEQLDCDYINASYLDPMECIPDLLVNRASTQRFLGESRFVATQGPLRETVGDLWKCVIYQQTALIVSLSGEFENGLQKCSAFWKPGTYESGNDIITVAVSAMEQRGNLVLRTFQAKINDTTLHQVLQVHLENWEDMTAVVDLQDLLSIVALKKHILSRIPQLPRYPTLIHCSAGCGRTGVFCVVDTLVGILDLNKNFELPHDPIYELVNNLRRQRILMVQTMRQYSFLYDVMVQYVCRGYQDPALCSLRIVEDYVSNWQ